MIPDPQPRSQYTEPKPPNTLQLVKDIMNQGEEDPEDIELQTVKDFVNDRLQVYVIAFEKPSSAKDIEAAFKVWYRANMKKLIGDNEARTMLHKELRYKAGAPVAAFLGRRKTTVNAYMTREGAIYTLKPQAVAQAVAQA